jgi:hypothetical protein
MSKYYETLSIGALTGFIQAPHPDARMVIGEVDGHIEQAGWLMPEVKNHVKEQPTNKWKQALIDRERARCAPKGWSHAGPDA